VYAECTPQIAALSKSLYGKVLLSSTYSLLGSDASSSLHKHRS